MSDSHTSSMPVNHLHDDTNIPANDSAPVATVAKTDAAKPVEAIDFKSLKLPQPLLDSLIEMQFTTPTPIQSMAIPHALAGKDILGSAQTGTGKTGAFGIPLAAKLLSNPKSTALVMTPTRELAVQVMQAMKKMLSKSQQIKMAVLIGGEPMPKQLNQLKLRPRLIIGTPGRINDHLARGTLKLNDAHFLVLDETDRMLDMGFGVQIDQVLKFMPQKRQTMMFSATLPANIIKMANRYMNEPVRVAAGNVSTPVEKIKQDNLKLSSGEKYTTLVNELNSCAGTVIVFVKSKHGADKLAFRLNKDEHNADAIHGDLRQNKRDKVIRHFRDGRTRVLVATDIAARGLDIPHIEHVINYDLPQCAEDYIHRIGRTGRAGAEGRALNFIAPEDNVKWRAIERLLNPNLPRSKEGSSEGNGEANGKRKSFGFKKRGPSNGQKHKGWKAGGPKRSFGEGSRNDRPQGDRPQGERPQGRVASKGNTRRFAD